ncbi:antitoxin VapB family protein [Halovivax limisalsi]|uniref:antitoxin VapB family protein n=1 Tax=Halovivax limisalsi TaxID=1453760 RepID=UPI001FFCCA02|nr:antitoxin VapB family protein [Halovivax limisalsi]
MTSKTIRISEENWERLRDLKRSDESFDDLVTRLTTSDKWRGFGALSETRAAEEMEAVRTQFEDELRDGTSRKET